MTVQLGLVQTCALALGVLLLGNLLNRLVPILRKNNIPEPVVGGIAFAAITTILYSQLGFAFAFLGSLAPGIALDLFGGLASPTAWLLAFTVMALGAAMGPVILFSLAKGRLR